MSWLKTGVASCCIGLSCLFGVRSAYANEPRVALSSKIGVSYQAPAACPGVDTFMLLLAQHLKGQDNAPLYAHVKISEAAPLHRLELTVYASVLPLRSEETASSCDELVRLAAFMAAVARTQPSPSDTVTELPEEEDSSEEETRETPPVAPVVAPREPTVAPIATGSRWLWAGQLQGGFGLLPGVTFGTGPLVELAWQSFAVRAAGSWWVPSEAASAGSLDSLAPLTLSLQSVDLGACLRHSLYQWATHGLSFGACAVLSGYRMGTESRQLGGSSDVAYRAGAGLSVGAMWALPGKLEVGAELGSSELSAPFRVQAAPLRESIYESRGSQMRFALLVGFRFGGGG